MVCLCSLIFMVDENTCVQLQSYEKTCDCVLVALEKYTLSRFFPGGWVIEPVHSADDFLPG